VVLAEPFGREPLVDSREPRHSQLLDPDLRVRPRQPAEVIRIIGEDLRPAGLDGLCHHESVGGVGRAGGSEQTSGRPAVGFAGFGDGSNGFEHSVDRGVSWAAAKRLRNHDHGDLHGRAQLERSGQVRPRSLLAEALDTEILNLLGRAIMRRLA